MEHEEVLENGSQTSAPGAPQCLLLSKAARAVVQEPCTDSHKIACSYKAPGERKDPCGREADSYKV